MRPPLVALVALVALVVLAGCTTTVAPSDPTTETPVVSPSATAGTPTPTAVPPDEPCTPVDRETVDPYREAVDPSPLPDPPTSRTRESVREYVTAFERAFARNGALSRESTQVESYVSDVSVRRTDRGWVVSLVSVTNTWAAGTDTADGTPTEVHGDGPRIPVSYHLLDDRLYRAAGGYDDTPAPDELGQVVACLG